MTDRPRFVAPRQAPAGLWRRTPPMIFAPILALLALALAWRAGIGEFSLPAGLADFLSGVAVALCLFAVVAYAAKIMRRPAVLGDELTTLPGRVGVDAGMVSLILSGGVLAPVSLIAGRAMLVCGLVALIALLVQDLRHLLARRSDRGQGGPAWQLRWTGLLAAAAVAQVTGWQVLAAWLVYPGAVAALITAGAAMAQLRAQRVPKVLLPLMALHLVPVAAYGVAAVALQAGFQQTAYGLTLAGLLLLPVFAWRAGTGLFLVVLTIPLSFAAWFLVALGAANPDLGAMRILGGLVLIAATLICLPLLFITLRDWARGQLAIRSNAAIA